MKMTAKEESFARSLRKLDLNNVRPQLQLSSQQQQLQPNQNHPPPHLRRLQHQPHQQHSLPHPLQLPQFHRRNEDVNYWRKRAGWFDDDEAMLQYNNGVYDAYYAQGGDGSGGGMNGGRRGHHSRSDIVKTILKVVCVLAALGLSALMLRAIMRRLSSSSSSSSSKEKKRSDSRSRSGRSKSRTRSRSRSRRGASEYNLMDEDADAKSTKSKRSHRSSRSKSRVSGGERRSSSRSIHTRSRSKIRDVKDDPPSHPSETILV